MQIDSGVTGVRTLRRREAGIESSERNRADLRVDCHACRLRWRRWPTRDALRHGPSQPDDTEPEEP